MSGAEQFGQSSETKTLIRMLSLRPTTVVVRDLIFVFTSVR